MTFTGPLGMAPPELFPHFDTSGNWAIFVRDDTNGDILGELEDFSKLTIISRFNDVGTFEIDTGLIGPATELVRRGKVGLVVRCGEDTVISGPITRAARTWDANGERVVVNGSDDLIWAASRIIRNWGINFYPFAGSFGWVLREMMRRGLDQDTGGGQGPPGPRGGPTITVPDFPRGPEPYPCEYEARWEPCLTAMQIAARQSRPVYGFDIRDLTFETWLPSDKGTFFSVDLGTMAGYSLIAERPDANTVFVLGKREDADRQWRSVEDAESRANWWRIETVVDAASAGDDPESGTDEDGNEWEGPWPDNQEALQVAAEEALAELVKPVACVVVPIDTRTQQFGLHYGLGDQATVILPDGIEFTETVSEVTITFEEGKPLTVVPTVGQPQMSLDTFRRLGIIDRRLSRLEARR